MEREQLRLSDMGAVRTLRRSSPRAAIAAAAACFLLVACSDGDDGNAQTGREGTSSATARSATTTSSAASSPTEAAVLSDYAAAKVALEEAERIPDPGHPPLAQRWTGEILKAVQRQLHILQVNGWVIRGTTTRNPKVISIEDTTAVVWDCVRTDGERYDAKTGEVVNPTGPLTLGFEETLVLEAGVWKISSRIDQEQACAGS